MGREPKAHLSLVVSFRGGGGIGFKDDFGVCRPTKTNAELIRFDYMNLFRIGWKPLTRLVEECGDMVLFQPRLQFAGHQIRPSRLLFLELT